MTRKLTDEQVKAIEEVGFEGFKIPINKKLAVVITLDYVVDDPYWRVSFTAEYLPYKSFITADEAIAYAEHLLNQRYCWLPQNNGWIMSGEVINLINAGKLLELMYLAYASDWCEWEDVWYAREGLCRGIGMPTSEEWSKGITIYPESPIWDAVKGVE
jgi:hypothetical protein